MSQVIIDVGNNANDGTGDSLRVAAGKINTNFTDRYADDLFTTNDILFHQSTIGTRSSNADLILTASGTGNIVFRPGIQISDNNIQAIRTNDDIIISASGSGKVNIDAIGFSGTSISSNDSSLININENLIVDGSLTVTGNTTLNTSFASATGTTFGTLIFANGSITDSSGAISFGNENLTTTGTINAGDNSQFGNLDLSDGLIVNYLGGSISFGDENISTTGTLSAATGSQFGDLDLLNGIINDSSGAISFGNENLSTSASSMSINSTLTVGSGSITDSTGAISFGNENLTTSGTLTVSGASTLASMAVSGATSFASPVTVDNLTFNDNIISTSSNSDLRLSPGGTGVVNVSNLTIDSSINFTDNIIKVTKSNDDFVLNGSGTGSVKINNIDLDSGTIDNVVIGGTTPSSGLFSPLNYTTLVIPDKITFSGNTISTNRSNDNLEFAANGSGKVVINGLALPNSDGGTGEFIQTDGSGNFSFASVSISLAESTIQDAQNTIGFTSRTIIDSNLAVGDHEEIISTQSVIDEFDQTQYDSAWYIALSRNEAADSAIEFQIQKHILAQGTEDGSTFDSFSGSSQIVRTSTSDAETELETDVRSASSNVRLLGRGGLLADSSVSSQNAIRFFRIGLGDNDSSGTQAASDLQQTIVVDDLDSAEATLDSWSISNFRGAKYFISINNTTTNEVSSTEVLLVHDGTNVFTNEYNTIVSNGSSTPLATFSADIDSGNARLRGANGTAGTCRVTMYRVLIADDSSASDGTYVDVLGEKTVTNTSQTTIDTDSFRGSASPDVSSEKVLSNFATTFDSVWYHLVTKDITNSEFSMKKVSINHGTTSDGSTQQAGLTDSSVLTTGAMNDINALTVGINGSLIELKATGVSDGSTAIKNASSYYAIGLGDNTADATSGAITTEAGVVLAGNTETTIDHVTASGETQSSLAAERTVASITASQYNGALYHVITRDLANGSFETQKISLLHDFQDAFVTSSAVTRTDVGDTHPTFDADIVTAGDSTSSVRLRATDNDGSSVTPSNTIAYYRVGIGDDDSTGYVGELGLQNDIVHLDIIDSSTVTLNQIAHGSHPAAKYFINVKNQSTGETGNMEALVTHNGTDAFITVYNEHFSGNNSLLTLTADISGTSFRLRGSATAGGSTKVIVNRIIAFGDSESEEANSDSTRKIIGNTIVSSSATEFDSFPADVTDAVHYVITGQKGSAENFICEASVITDGTEVFVSQGPNVSSKSTDMLEISATISSGIVSVKASSTSGSSTVQAYAIRLKAPTVQTQTIDSFAKASFRGAKYYVSATESDTGSVTNIEAMVVHDGTNAFISTFNQHNSASSLVTLTAAVSGSNVVLTGISTVPNTTIKFYRIILADNESDSTGTDRNVIGAVTVSSSATAIDTFEHTAHTGAHYIIVGHNSGEASASIMEATVLTNGAEAFVSEGPFVSSKESPQLTLSAAHNGSTTVTLSAASTSGSSTTVNAYRIHMLRGDADAFTELDSFDHSTTQAANYILTFKDADNRVQMSDVMLVSDGTDAYHVEIDINSVSASTPLITVTSAVDGSDVKLRAESTIEKSSTTANGWKVGLARAAGTPASTATLDSFSATNFRSAMYHVSIVDNNSGALGNYETCDIRVTHDGSDAYLAISGRTSSTGSDLVTFSADIDSGNVRLRGTISSTNTHTVTVVRRLIDV